MNQQLINALSECIGHCQTSREMRKVISLMSELAGKDVQVLRPVSPEHEYLLDLYKEDNASEYGYNKIELIKAHRLRSCPSLTEAKQFVESVFGEYRADYQRMDDC